MAIKLSKGQKVNLRKDNPNLKRVLVGLGWDPVDAADDESSMVEEKKEEGIIGGIKKLFGITPKTSVTLPQQPKFDIDIDASVILITKSGCHEGTVYYGRLRSYDGAIIHHGDNLTGEGEEGQDDEQIEIKLEQISEKIQTLSIIINIYEAYHKKQTFEQIRNCYVHVTDMDSGRELVRYDIDGEFKGMTGIFVADLERSGNDWHFEAIGEGVRVRSINEMVAMKCKG